MIRNLISWPANDDSSLHIPETIISMLLESKLEGMRRCFRLFDRRMCKIFSNWSLKFWDFLPKVNVFGTFETKISQIWMFIQILIILFYRIEYLFHWIKLFCQFSPKIQSNSEWMSFFWSVPKKEISTKSNKFCNRVRLT